MDNFNEVSLESFNKFLKLLNKDQFRDDKDKLSLLIHFIMRQSGFKYVALSNSSNSTDEKSKEDEEEISFLNEIKSNVFTKLHYNTIEFSLKNNKIMTTFKFDSNIIISLLSSSHNKNIELNSHYKNFSSIHFKQYSADYFLSHLDDSSIIHFTNAFKDLILNPIKYYLKRNDMNELCQLNNFSFINNLDSLPIELIQHIALRYLDIKKILKLKLLCRKFESIFNGSNQILWKSLIERDYPTRYFEILDMINHENEHFYYHKYVQLYVKSSKY
jgi:hypothetical protein